MRAKAPSQTEYPLLTRMAKLVISFEGINFVKFWNVLIYEETWFTLGMPGVSITLNPILNYSTVTISWVVPGNADSVSKTGSFFFFFSFAKAVEAFFLSYALSIALIKVDFPEFVVPMT